MKIKALPASVKEFTPELFTNLLQQQYPQAVVESFEIVKALQYGEGMVSTAARAILNFTYQPGCVDNLPTRVILKLAYDLEDLPSPLYVNEVNFYKKIRQEITIEAPRCLGAHYDPDSRHFALLLEDLGERSAQFPNALAPLTIAQVESVLDNLASLHAQFWQSPRFSSDLNWLETHVSGELADFMNKQVPYAIQHEIDTNMFKHELVAKMGSSGDELLSGLLAVQRHQSTLPQTLLHGDTHIGNVYLLAEGPGLLDWQLMVRGYCIHDVNYFITTALPIDQRRLYERDLLQHYLSKLAHYGVKNPPSFDEAWKEYRRTLIWGVYIGWLTTNVANYGWEINTLNLLRLTTAYDDLGTDALVKELL
ncbi:MAG: phosphotransferase [Spongiibacteraceae bacterium]